MTSAHITKRGRDVLVKTRANQALRDHFAALAMHAMLSNPRTTESLALFSAMEVESKIAEAVYKMADVMMKARAQ
jgi:hypothetical protein